jgi:hypothetical protein
MRGDGASSRSQGGAGGGSLATAAALVVVAAILGGPAGTAAQLEPPPPPSAAGTTVEVVPGPEYRAGWLRRVLIGENYRDLWLRPVTAPVLDLDEFAGGLEPEEQGGNQSKTLHLLGADGREYIFRSVNKFPHQALPEDLQHTLFADIADDHVSAFHPGGAFVVPRLHEELGHLPVPPVYRVMPDDPRLGEFRETFGGMLGYMVVRPNEGDEGQALFAGSHRIVGTDELYDKLEEGPRHRLAAREYLETRFVDILVGDTDRGGDQWRWARVPAEDGFRWRPVIRDRDWAFVDAQGLFPALARRFYPKLVEFGPTFASLESAIWDQGMGRRLLVGLDRADWEETVARVQRVLTDDVIREAIDRLPPAQKPGYADGMTDAVIARRDSLEGLALDWYRLLATDVDVRGTDRPDRAEIVRRDDGSVSVTLLGPVELMTPIVPGAGDDEEEAEEHARDPYYRPDVGWEGPATEWQPYYRRTFLPDETAEVRVYLLEGADTAIVRGTGPGAITVRVVGGEGDDYLQDAAESGGATVLYDAEGDNRLIPGPRTGVRTDAFEVDEEESAGFLAQKTGADEIRDWGQERSWLSPAVAYEEGAGIIIGAGPEWTDYQFRSNPYGSKVAVKGLYATGSNGLGIDAVAEGRPENSPGFFRVHARATQFDAIRFYGYGNTSADIPDDQSLIMQDRALLEVLLGSESDDLSMEVGAVVRYTDPRVPEGNPAEVAGLAGADALGEAGGIARLAVSRVDDRSVPGRGVEAELEATAFPGAGGRAGPWAGGQAELRGYVTIPVLTDPVLAARAGVRGAWGDFPIHGAAWLGGSSTLRGYRWQRFAGDEAVYGGVDLRIPLFRANLFLVRGRLGVIGFADAGRVRFEGAPDGDWHTGHGAGVMLETLDTAIHLLWARGEEDRLYVGLGMPF